MFAALVGTSGQTRIHARAGVPASQATRAEPGDVLAGLADPDFENMGARQGLPHDSVYGFAQDSRGFVWIATFGGLSRYDGYRLRNYLHDDHNPRSLPDNNVRLLLAATGGGLWIATGNAGVISWDPATDSFHPLPHLPAKLQHSHIFCMSGDGEGGLWFGSQLGLVHYRAATESYEIYGEAAGKAAAQGFTEGSVFAVLPDREGNLWVGGDHGLLVRRRGSERFEAVPGLEGSGQIGVAPPVWTIFEDREGRLWVGTDQSGVGLLNRATGRIEGVRGLAGANSLMGAATVRGIVEVRKNLFWMATYGSGLITLDLGTGEAHRYERDLTSATPLSNNFMRGIFMDRAGMIWLGTDRGLSRVNSAAEGLLNIHCSPLRTQGLDGNEVRSVTSQGDRIWVGFDQGGFAVIEPDGRIENVRPAAGVAEADQSRREVLAIRAAGPEVVYAGGVGLYEIDARRLTYRPVPNALVMKQVINALLVEGNTVWAATYNGLVRYDRTTHEAKMYAHAVNDAGSLADNYVRDMLRDSRGRLWVTTRLGLDRLDEATGRFIHIRHDAKVADSLPSDNVQPIAEDRRGRLWIGTIGDGLTVLWKWTPDGKPHFRTLRRADGFPSDIVLTVMRGADGRMWSNTPGGLAVVDPEMLRFHTYTAADGLRTSSQNLFGSATLRDGTIVFPGDEGLIVVRPELLHTTRPAPRLVATEIRVPGSAQSAEALAWDSLTQGIVLPAGEKDFQAGFALVDTTAPDAVRYRYKLEGFDEEWLDTPSWSRTAAYTNLPAGRYRLLIQSEGRPGADTSAQLEIPVVVMAAWYESSWFFLLKVAGILVLLLVAVRLRTAVIRRRQKELERDVKARTTELATKQAELLEANQRLAELATRDALTGAYNRRQFLEIAPGEIERARHTGGGCTLLLIDADHFKAINDRYGHMAGDAVLRELVARLAAQLRKDDVIARYGGEELVVLLPHTRLTDGLHLAERLRAGIAAAPMVWLDHAIRVTISIGAVEAEGSESLDELLRRADGALYEAKDAGRDRVLAAPPGENQPR